MKMKATRFYLGSLLMLLLGSSLWVGCNYKYEDRYSYAKENASYLDAVKATAHAALLADSRVRAILDGTDVDAKAALQTLLDDMQNLQKDTDGVVYAALVESFLQNSSIVQADATKSIGVLATMMKASAAHDRNSAMAEGVRDDGKADAARSAMTAYAAQRDSETLKALLNTYYGAIAGDHASLASSAPIASAWHGRGMSC